MDFNIILLNSAKDDGVIPEIRPAAPRVSGEALASFSRSSMDKTTQQEVSSKLLSSMTCDAYVVFLRSLSRPAA